MAIYNVLVKCIVNRKFKKQLTLPFANDQYLLSVQFWSNVMVSITSFVVQA